MYKKKIITTILLCTLAGVGVTFAQNHVSNIKVQLHDLMLIVTYDLATRSDIELFVSFDGGITYRGPLQHVSGAVGKGIYPEKSKILIWNIVDEVGYVDYPNTMIKIVSLDDEYRHQTIDPDMAFVQGGTFTMRSRSVTLSSFNIGKYEVTQAQWVAIMGTNPSRFKGDNKPVDMVRWSDIVGTSGDYMMINGVIYFENGFIYKLNKQTGKRYRLPSEAEWEYAARGGNQSKGNIYSGSNTIGDVAWYSRNSRRSTHPVGTKAPNELGIYDMSGNVWEWCSLSKGSVLRGGSYFSSPQGCRVFYNAGMYAHDRCFGCYGFRIVINE